MQWPYSLGAFVGLRFRPERISSRSLVYVVRVVSGLPGIVDPGAELIADSFFHADKINRSKGNQLKFLLHRRVDMMRKKLAPRQNFEGVYSSSTILKYYSL